MVTPVTVTTTNTAGTTVLDLFGIFNVQMVPEPGSAWLLAFGVGAVLLLGRARR